MDQAGDPVAICLCQAVLPFLAWFCAGPPWLFHAAKPVHAGSPAPQLPPEFLPHRGSCQKWTRCDLRFSPFFIFVSVDAWSYFTLPALNLLPESRRLLDESMQQNHRAIFVDVEKHVGNSILGQCRSHFLEAAAQRSANGHPNRPAELDCFDVLANPLAVLIQKANSSANLAEVLRQRWPESKPAELAYLVYWAAQIEPEDQWEA